MGKRIGIIVLGLVLFIGPSVVMAESDWASEATYADQAIGKLKFGVKNTLLGWTSLFRTTSDEIQAGENPIVGLSKGVWDAVGQTVGGAVHAVTFPLPQIDIPLPKGGTDVLS